MLSSCLTALEAQFYVNIMRSKYRRAVMNLGDTVRVKTGEHKNKIGVVTYRSSDESGTSGLILTVKLNEDGEEITIYDETELETMSGKATASGS
jgi:hypothetical protein